MREPQAMQASAVLTSRRLECRHSNGGNVTRKRPGMVRDAIVQVLEGRQHGASVQEITSEVIELIDDVPPSSVRPAS